MSATDGQWESPQVFQVPDQTRFDRSGVNSVVDKRGLFVLHSFLLRSGKVLVFCGHTENADYGGNPNGLVSAGYRGVSYVFDPGSPNTNMVPKYFPRGMDLFCCHYVQIPDGRVLVVGGSLDFHMHGSVGAKNICFFDPTTEQWVLSTTGSRTNELAQGRWYPTAVLMGNGEVAVFSGRDEGVDEVNAAGEPVFRRTTKLGPIAPVPTVGGAPVYVDSGGNNISLFVNAGGIPHTFDDTGTMLVLVEEIGTGNFFFLNTANGQVFTGAVVGGADVFTRITTVPLSSLNLLIQRRWGISDEVELLSPPNYAARTLSGATFELPIYPGMHLSPNGKIYFTGTNWGQEINNPSTRELTINSTTGSGSWNNFGGSLSPNQPNREEGMSVLLPPAQDGKILLFGGSLALDAQGFPILQRLGNLSFNRIHTSTDPTSAEILDTLASPPTWTPTANTLNHGRINGHAVILPDETVFIAGGHNNFKWLSTANGTAPSLVCEIFDGTSFRTVASMTHPRMYHSTALLLPDGKVMISGGADPNHLEPALHQNPNGTPRRFTPPFINDRGQEQPYPETWDGPTYGFFDLAGNYNSMALNRKDYEIYKPPYFFKGSRPVITDVLRNGSSSRQVFYEQQFRITTPDAANITKVAFMRPGGPTHHTDTEQRYVRLDFSLVSNQLNVTVPSNRNLAPPGYYMLWIMRNATSPNTGLVPCERALFIQLAEPPPAPTPTSLNDDDCIIATTTLGSANHEMVIYLQDLRREIRNSSNMGSEFIKLVNNVYYSLSPYIVHIISNDLRAREYIRQLIVIPTVKIIRTVEMSTRRLISPVWHNNAIILGMIISLLFGIVLLPLLLLLTMQSLIRQKAHRNGRE